MSPGRVASLGLPRVTLPLRSLCQLSQLCQSPAMSCCIPQGRDRDRDTACSPPAWTECPYCCSVTGLIIYYYYFFKIKILLSFIK